jgi:hypothetical protein
VLKLLVGLLKGAVVGGAIGYGAYSIGLFNEVPWLACGVAGVLVGLIAGRPIWSLITDKNATSVVAILRAVFGFGVGCGLYALVAKVWQPAPLDVSGVNVFGWPVVGAIGAVWGVLLEVDDAIGADPKDKALDRGDKSERLEKPAAKQLKK